MKQRRHFDIFSLSFLDVVSCGFGAMVMLILIARPVEGDPRGGVDDTRTLLQTVFAAQEDSRQAQEELHKLRDHISRTQEQLAALARMTQSLEDQAADEKKGLAVLKDKADGLQVVKTSVTSASITPATARKRDLEVGGIPVDSEYVIFIVDTSGSMQQIWGRVTKEMKNLLNIHPRVHGFQIMNDNGTYLVSGYANKWIPDTSQRRKDALKLFRNWSPMSSSSPVEGLSAALRTYAKSGKKISVYIVGDDYTGSSYDPVLDALDDLNRARGSSAPLIKVHGLGFRTPLSNPVRFSTLMREVAARNAGTFLALP